MSTFTATGAAMIKMTVPEMRQLVYTIRGGMKKDVEDKSFGTNLRAEGLP